MEIISASNERVKGWARLQKKKGRDQRGEFLIEGEHLIEEAMRGGHVKELLILKGRQNPFAMEAIVCSEEVMRKLSSSVSGAWLIAVCALKPSAPLPRRRVVLLDGVQDPGNVGTILRTACAFGYDQLILSQDCADVLNEKCIRSTQGALFHLNWQRQDLCEAIAQLQEEGFTVIATALRQSRPLREVSAGEKTALVFGSEGQGIRPQVLSLCDQRARIEMDHFESLSVAVAAGICLYRFREGS